MLPVMALIERDDLRPGRLTHQVPVLPRGFICAVSTASEPLAEDITLAISFSAAISQILAVNLIEGAVAVPAKEAKS